MKKTTARKCTVLLILPQLFPSSLLTSCYYSLQLCLTPIPALGSSTSPGLFPFIFFLDYYSTTLLTSNSLLPSLKIPVTYLYSLWPVTYLATLYQIFTRQTPMVLLDLLTDYSGSSVPSSSPPYFLLPISSSFLLPQPSVLLR